MPFLHQSGKLGRKYGNPFPHNKRVYKKFTEESLFYFASLIKSQKIVIVASHDYHSSLYIKFLSLRGCYSGKPFFFSMRMIIQYHRKT